MCLALPPVFPHCFALWSLLFFYLFTKECKYLEVVFPLAFHFYHHLPLWKTESFDLSLTKSLFQCDLHLLGALIPPPLALASWRILEKWPISGFFLQILEFVVHVSWPKHQVFCWSVWQLLSFESDEANWLFLVDMPSVTLMKVLFTVFTSATCFSDGSQRLSAAFFKVAYQADKWKEGPPIISN